MKNLIALIFLISCSTQVDKPVNTNDEFPEISNRSFSSVKKVYYNEGDDSFADGDAQNFTTEAISLMDKSDLEDMATGADALSSAIAACDLGKMDKANMIFDKLYLSYVNNPIYWNIIGSCYFRQNKTKKAQLYFSKAMATSPKYSPALNNLGVSYAKIGNDQKAIAFFNKAISSSKNAKTPRLNAAVLYLRYGVYDKALTLIASLPRNDITNALKATALLFKGEITKAKDLYEDVDSDYLEKYPSFGLNYVLSLYLAGEIDDASKMILKVKVRRSTDLIKFKNDLSKLIARSRQ